MKIKISVTKRRNRFWFLLAICTSIALVFQSLLHLQASSSFSQVDKNNNNDYSSFDVPHHVAAATTKKNSTIATSEPRQKQQKESLKDKRKTTTDVPEQQQQRQRLQPKVILHIGPHKTGTTLIQQFLKETSVIELLRQDNMVMPTYNDLPGLNKKFPEFNWGGCIAMRKNKQTIVDRCRKWPLAYFANYTKATYAKGQDIIMVTEDLDDPDIVNMTLLRKSLLPYTDIHIIVSYRRLHDWFKSWYVEIVRLYQKVYFSRSEPFVSYTDWLEKHGNFDKFLNRHAIALEATYQRQTNVTVSVLHYHQRKTSLLENLFCHVLKNHAPNTCQSILEHAGHTFKDSTGYARVSKQDEMEVCRLVWYAKNFDMPNGLQHCQHVAEMYLPLFQQYNISIRRDFPVLLPPQSMLDIIWNQTVLAETKYFSQLVVVEEKGTDEQQQQQEPTPEFWTNLRRDYDHAIASKWYSTDVGEMNRTNHYDRIMSEKGIDEDAALIRYCGKDLECSRYSSERKRKSLSTAPTDNSTTRDDDANVVGQSPTAVWNCLEVKDAEQFVEEWLDYHFAAGFTFVRIFDNSDNFTMQHWTGPHDKYKGKVKISHHFNVPGKVGTQAKAYKECLEEAIAQKVDWVATVDVDEFLVMRKHGSIVDLLNDHCPKKNMCGQLSFNWRMFGSANQTKYHPIPVTRRFQYRTDGWQGTIKTIVDPRAVDLENFHWQHSMRLKPEYNWLDTNGTIITKNKGWHAMTNDYNPSDVAVLHHYRYKSQEEWDFVNCVRGCQHISKCQMRCNTTAEVGTIFDDAAWQQLRRMVPSYQKFDDVGELS